MAIYQVKWGLSYARRTKQVGSVWHVLKDGKTIATYDNRDRASALVRQLQVEEGKRGTHG